jgi:hypothetical protein
MTYSFLSSNPDAYWSFTNNTVYPLPDTSVNATPTALLGDLTLYTLANFARQLLNSNLLPRFASDMLNVGISNANLPTYQDGYAVSEVVFYPLYPNILSTTNFKFPLLSISQKGMTPFEFSTVYNALQRDFTITWIMPPMLSTQLNALAPWLSTIAQVFTGYLPLGYDPKLNQTNSCWLNIGIGWGQTGKVNLAPFKGQQVVNGNFQDAVFPAFSIDYSLVELEQLGLPQNFPYSFTGLDITQYTADGYNPNNPFLFTDAYAPVGLGITSLTPNSGSARNGNTLVILDGYTFISSNTYTVSLNGSTCKAVTVTNPNVLMCVSNPSINYATGTGNVVVTDQFGNSTTFVNGWTYI